MGSGFSRKNKQVEEKQTENQTNHTTVCSKCGCDSGNRQQIQRRNVESKEGSPQVLDIEKERSEKATNEKRNNFFFYPSKDSHEDETLYVTTSQFPYTKPKAVVVRQHVVSGGTGINDQHFPRQTENDMMSMKTQIYPKLNAALKEHLGVNDGNRAYHFVNDRRWSTPNVLPSSGFASQKVLPHRTVAELRRCSLDYPGTDHYDGFYSYNCQVSETGRRPPTPTPTAWYPARRSYDYLVAPSLLAMERERDIRKREDKSKTSSKTF